MKITRQLDRNWTDTHFAGIQACQTWADENGDGGYLAKFIAGARFPRHSHDGWEQIYVLEGAVRFNEVELRPGDVLQVQGSDEHEAYALEDTLLFVAHRGGIEVTE